MKSRKYCEKMFILFGVSNITELKQVVSKCTFDQDMKYTYSLSAAPSILNYIKLEDMATIN